MRDRLDRFLVVGALIHLAAFVVVRACAPIGPSVQAHAVNEATQSTAWIELSRDEPPPPSTPAPLRPTDARAPASLAMVTQPHRSMTATTPEPEPASSASSGPAAPSGSSDAPPSSSSATVAEPAPARPGVPFLAGSADSLLGPTVGFPSARIDDSKSKKLDKDLGRLVDAQQLSHGGGSGGPVVGAAHTAMSAADAPEIGHAILELETDATGAIVSSHMVDGTGAATDWRRVLTAIEKSLAGQKLHVPSGARGVRVRIEIDARPRLPSGAADRTPHVDSVGGQTVEDSKGSGSTLPGASGTWGDLSDIGAKKTRQTRVHIVLDERL